MATGGAVGRESVEIAGQGRNTAADRAVDYIQRLIDLRRVLPGQRLPAATLLSEKIGVSRVAVLQALQTLQRYGLVTVRAGRGGTVVLGRDERPYAQRLARALAQRDALQKTALMREIIESGVARTVAQQGLSEEAGARARTLLAEMRRADDLDRYLGLDSDFHDLLGEATGAPLLAALSAGLRWVFLVALDAVDQPRERLLKLNSTSEHERILRAIERGSASAAAEWAFRHAQSSMRLVLTELDWTDFIAFDRRAGNGGQVTGDDARGRKRRRGKGSE